MSVFDRIFRRNSNRSEEPRPSALNIDDKTHRDVVVGASKDSDEKQIQSFSNNNITFSGELSDYDYDSILRDKQTNIYSLYQLADYYADADSIVRGIIKHVYVPFSTSSKWVLSGSKKKTIDLYEKYYKKIRLKEKLDGIMLEYWKYGNVFVYVMDGNIITLPVNKCKIGNVTLNGEPLVDFDCQSIINEWRAKSYSVKEGWIKDNNLEDYFKGYPDEIVNAVNHGWQYAQLDPSHTFVMQASKESWQRYAIPFIASCLPALAKKELISQYEDAILNLGIRSFVHVTYGDTTKGNDILPDRNELTAVRSLFQKGMSGFPLVVTNHLAKATVVQADMDDLFQWDKYKVVNSDILSAGGVSGIIVNGISDDGSTFASAQISMQTVEARIEAARDEFCDMMNRINVLLTEYIDGTYNLKDVPTFAFMPLEMTGKKALRDACSELYNSGLISTKTMLETNGYNMDIEKEQKLQEQKDGVDQIFIPVDSKQSQTTTTTDSTSEDGDGPGRKQLDDSERTSDEESAIRGKMPKPSNPEGSLDT